MSRDDFPVSVKRTLAQRVGYRCSRPSCGRPTAGPHADPHKAVNLGAAAHIRAASPDGPRYDPGITPEERKSADNGIWLCATCHALIDRDEVRYSVELLEGWKKSAETAASLRMQYPDIYERLPRLRYFTELDEYLKGPRSQYLERDYFEKGLVYFPEEYLSRIRKLLRENRRCLIIGYAGAGKTVLATALARQFQRTEGYRVFYTDAARAHEGDGRIWYQILLADDCQYTLYILDNCHLAPGEVNEFCYQWDGLPLKQAQVIMISRPETRELEAEFGEIGYFEALGNVTLEIESTKTWCGVLRTYSKVFRQQDPSKYAPLEDDDHQKLEEQHAHNLAVSRVCLEAWHDIGGRLGEITTEDVYGLLNRRYLIKAKRSLPALCALWQYEIPAHSKFVDQMDKEELRWLEAQGLMTFSHEPGYGQLYYPLFHSEQARMIFETSIYREWGRVDTNLVEVETIHLLKAYLSTMPPNYMSVYDGLYHQEYEVIEHRLLADCDLQACAISQFETGNISNAAKYLWVLSKVIPSRAKELLDELVQDFGIDGICSEMLRHKLHDIQFSLYYFQRVDAELARAIITEIDMEQLTRRAEMDSFENLSWSVRTFSGISPQRTRALLDSIPIQELAAKASVSDFVSVSKFMCYLQGLNYPSTRLQSFVNLLDLEQLSQQTKTQSHRAFALLIDSIKTISPRQTKRLLEIILAKMLVTETLASPYSKGREIGIICLLKKLDYPSDKLEGFVELIDIEQLATAIRAMRLKDVSWLIQDASTISPSLANDLLEAITPTGFEDILNRSSLEESGRAIDIIYLLKKLDYPSDKLEGFVELIDIEQLATAIRAMRLKDVSWLIQDASTISPSLANCLLEAITPAGFEDMLSRSSLEEAGTFFHYHYTHCKNVYALFREHHLADKLGRESLKEIRKFIGRIGGTRHVGKDLAHDALDLLVTRDVIAAVVENSRLHGVRSLMKTIAHFGEQYDVVTAVLESRAVRGIQFLIDNASIDKEYLESIRQSLRGLDIADQLAVAGLDDLARMLWTIFTCVDENMAREYCTIIDMQQRSEQLRTATSNALCHFLWNITQIGDLSRLRTLDDPIIKNRLLDLWTSDVGLGAKLLGIVATTLPRICEDVLLPPIETQIQKDQLASCFIRTDGEQDLFAAAVNLALTVRGLRCYDEVVAQTIVQQYLPIWEASGLLADALASARTPKALALLQETCEWLSVALFEKTIEQLDELQETAERLLEPPTNLDADKVESTQ